MGNDSNKFTRKSEPSSSSRYNRSEWKRRGSRYADKAEGQSRRRSSGKSAGTAKNRLFADEQEIRVPAVQDTLLAGEEYEPAAELTADDGAAEEAKAASETEFALPAGEETVFSGEGESVTGQNSQEEKEEAEAESEDGEEPEGEETEEEPEEGEESEEEPEGEEAEEEPEGEDEAEEETVADEAGKNSEEDETEEESEGEEAEEEPEEDAAAEEDGENLAEETDPAARAFQENENAGLSFRERLSRHDPAMIGLTLVAGALLIAYIVVGVFFGSHFYPGTEVYGIDWSRKTVEEVRQDVTDQIGRYTLTIHERGGETEQITAGQIGLVYEDHNDIERALESQHSFAWPFMMLMNRKASAKIDTTYRRDGMDAIIGSLDCLQKENMQRPKNAHIGMNEDGTALAVIPEVEGTYLDYETTKEMILKALDSGTNSIDLDDGSCYLRPSVYEDDASLQKEVSEKNELLGAKITYDFGDRQEVVDASVIKTFLSKDETGGFWIDSDKVWQYVARLAEKYDTYEGYRIFHTSIGTTVELNGGDYGWLIDQETTATQLLDALQNKAVETIEPVYFYTAMSRSEDDIGGTYVEVCISRQEMWCYQNGYLIVDTPVVTGTPATGHGTPSGGVWSIDGKFPNYTLVGPDYRAPVQYWLPFNGDVGIHDLSNRYYFGGDIYLYNGSHGCVNTPLDAVAQIFDIVSTGTAVVVYE